MVAVSAHGAAPQHRKVHRRDLGTEPLIASIPKSSVLKTGFRNCANATRRLRGILPVFSLMLNHEDKIDYANRKRLSEIIVLACA